jgi:phage-related protein
MRRPQQPDQPKPVHWVGSSKADLSTFPDDVKRRVGGALWDAQTGQKASFAKPLKGFGGGGVAVEVINHFQDETPKREMDLIRQRLNRASEEYEQWQRSERKRSQ